MELANSAEPLKRHAGVLGLAAIIQAFPYTVPGFLPDVLMKLCRYASEKQPLNVSLGSGGGNSLLRTRFRRR